MFSTRPSQQPSCFASVFVSVFAFATLARADIASTNDTIAAITENQATYTLQSPTTGSNWQDLTTIVPLTKAALDYQNKEPQNLVHTTSSNAANLSRGESPYISCTDGDNGFMEPSAVLASVLEAGNFTAPVIFYSTAGNFCAWSDVPASMRDYALYSMTSMQDSQKVLQDMNNTPSSNKFFVNVARSGGDQGSNNQTNQDNPLGPSPSTAVAMIILYSITGIITALFLVIIVTGAVRAHRHPDRYGPRDILGRPRQSRARGLGRAILDTIPIVKFGEREAPKPTDVELGPAATTEARNVDGANDGQALEGTEADPRSNTQAAEAQREAPAEIPSGIAPAEVPIIAAAAAPGSEHTSAADEGLGCSICTDDFEMGQDIRVLPCNHKFHPDCVDPWLLNVSGTCPLCRVDLRPVRSNSSSSTTNGDEAGHNPDADALGPSLNPESEPSTRRRSALRDILSLRSRPNHSTEERISALRRLRETRGNHSGDVNVSGEPANTSVEDIASQRRSHRFSNRLSAVFGGSRTVQANNTPSASAMPEVPRVPASAGTDSSAAPAPVPASAPGLPPASGVTPEQPR